MPRYNISPSAQSQAEKNPAAFIEAEEDALMMGLETLFPSMPRKLVIEMAERHKECHMLFEVRERADRIVKDAKRKRRGPMREDVERLIRETEAHGDPCLLPDLYALRQRLLEDDDGPDVE